MTRKQRLLSALTGIALTPAAWGQGHGLALEDYNHVVWTAKDGAPTGITALAQTPDGWLWMGAPTGVYRFDGVRFYPLAAKNGAKLLGSQVWALAAEPNGDLYIGYVHGGLSVLHADGRLEHLAPATKEGPVRWTYQVVRDIDGSVWVGSTSGLLHLEHGRWTKMGPDRGFPEQIAPLVALDSGGQLWAGSGKQLFRYDRTARRFAAADLPPPGRGEAPDAFEMTMSPDGRLWRTGNRRFTLVSSPAPGAAGWLGSIPPRQGGYYGIFDRSGNLWALRCPAGVCLAAAAVANADGQIDVAAATTSRLDQPGQLSSLSPNVILEDREGNIWIGTPIGIERFRRNALLPVPVPLNNSASYRISTDARGSAWLVLARSHQGFHYDPVRRRFIDMPGKYYDTASGPAGAVFLKADGIRLRRGGVETHINLPLQGPDPEKGAWVRDDGERVWLGVHGARGLGTSVQLWDGREWRPLADLDRDNLIFGAAGRHGQMWVGLDDGRLLLFEGGRRRTEYDQAGLGGIGVVQHVTTSPELVVGGQAGMVVQHEGRFQRLLAQRDDVLQNVSGFFVAADGSRWVNTAAGLLRIDASDWRRSVDTGLPLRYELLDALDGYPGSSDPMRISLNRVDGRLWVNATGGIVELDPSQRERNLVRPQPVLLAVTGDGVDYSLLQAPLIRAGTTRLRFDFTAPSLRKPERIVFSYRLDGVDKTWQASSERSATYTELAPGNYRFRLRAMNEDGLWSERERTLDLQVAPTLVQTMYFKVACALGSLLLLWLGYRLRLRRVLRRLQLRFDDRVAERERIARDLHDTLLQSMQGLFLGFRRIASRTPETAPTRAMMEETLAVALEILEEGRDKVGSLRGATGQRDDLIDILRSYGERLAKQHGNAFALTLAGAPRALPAAVHDELQAIAREALNNAFNHAQARHVMVRIVFEERELEVTVADDGVGIPPGSAAGRAGHWGLPGMRERAAQLGAQLGVSTGMGQGTSWRLVVPARIAYGTAGQDKAVVGEPG